MSVQSTLFRQVAGSFTTGVTVVLTGRDGDYRGLTASSFASLSLDPQLVLICVDREAQTLPMIRQTGHFSVNILSAEQRWLSQQFASKSLSQQEKMNDVDFRLGVSGVPILHNVIAFFECKQTSEYEGGDHVIIVGEVIDAGCVDESSPLVYFRGAYRDA